jgi:hypothetical protein
MNLGANSCFMFSYRAAGDLLPREAKRLAHNGRHDHSSSIIFSAKFPERHKSHGAERSRVASAAWHRRKSSSQDARPVDDRTGLVFGKHRKLGEPARTLDPVRYSAQRRRALADPAEQNRHVNGKTLPHKPAREVKEQLFDTEYFVQDEDSAWMVRCRKRIPAALASYVRPASTE